MNHILIIKDSSVFTVFGKKGLEWLREQIKNLDSVDQFILETELYRIDILQTHIKEVEQRILIQTEITEDVTLLMTIIGIDIFTALLFLYEIGDINRFPSASKLSSWLGLVPKVHQSGDGRKQTYERKLKNLERSLRKAQTNPGEVLIQCFSS